MMDTVSFVERENIQGESINKITEMTEQRDKLNLATSLNKRIKKMKNGERSRIERKWKNKCALCIAGS